MTLTFNVATRGNSVEFVKVIALCKLELFYTTMAHKIIILGLNYLFHNVSFIHYSVYAYKSFV